MTTQFTFLNTSDAPRLGASDTKRMRAHVTKSNFAQRRRRLAKERQSDDVQQAILESPDHAKQIVTRRPAVSTPPLAPKPCSIGPLYNFSTYTDMSIKFLLHEFRPLIFPAGTGSPGSRNEAQWIRLFMAEPALLEASMVIALRNRPGFQSPSCSDMADQHAVRAIHILNKRLSTASTGLTDGVLSAVFTLALSERLVNNDTAWNIHINGLSQIIRLRRSNGVDEVPPWFSDFLLYESVSEMMATPKKPPKKIIDALTPLGGLTEPNFSRICWDMHMLRQGLNRYYTHPDEADHLSRQIGERVDGLQGEIDTLLQNSGPHIRAWASALRIFVFLSWPPKLAVCFRDLAERLRDMLAAPGIRLCSSIDMTVWQFFVGAVASEEGSDTRIWFTTRVRKMFSPMHVREWKTVMGVLEKGFGPDIQLMERFQRVWDEVK